MLITNFIRLAFLLGIFFVGVCNLDAQVINPQIKDLSIGSKYNHIVKKLGKPLSDTRSGVVPCGGTMRTLFYGGLILRLEVGGIEPLGLYKVEVTSEKWPVSGLRIGARRSDVVKKFGPGPYYILDGYARFQYKRSRLAKIEWEFNYC